MVTAATKNGLPVKTGNRLFYDSCFIISRLRQAIQMAYQEDQAQIFRDALADMPGVAEKKMFGGLCFMVNRHMVCGVHGDGGMARVGKAREAAAVRFDGVHPLSFGGRRMGGMVELTDAALRNAATRSSVLRLAIEFISSLPDKK